VPGPSTAVYVLAPTLELLSDASCQAVAGATSTITCGFRDPAPQPVTRIPQPGLFFLPLMRTLCDRYGTWPS